MSSTTMRGIHYLLLRFWLVLLFVTISSPLGLFCFWVIQQLEAHHQPILFVRLTAGVALVYLIGLSWLANQTAAQIAFKDRRLTLALKCAFNDLQFHLAFLPFVGHRFTRREDKRDSEGKSD